MIKAIFFDLDDTLLWDQKSVSEAFRITCQLAEDKYGISPDLLEEKVRENAREIYATYDIYPFTQMIGINPFEGLWGEFRDEGEGFQEMRRIAPEYQRRAWTQGLKDAGIDDSDFGIELAEAFPDARKNSPFLFDDTLPVLEGVKKDYQLLLLTNGSPDLQHTKLDITPEIKKDIDKIIISGDFGKGKPDESLFQYALDECGVKKEEVIMVGDNLNTDIEGATRLGMFSCWVNWKQQKREETQSAPTYEISRLGELPALLEAISEE